MQQLLVTTLGSAFMLMLSLGLPLPAKATPVEYRISGLLTASNLVDAPFHISIFADTDTAVRFGRIPGAGTAFVNTSGRATWNVEGFGTATSGHVQVVSIPATAAIGFGWNGELYPINTDQPAEQIFGFSDSAFALDSSYGLLNAVVPTISLALRTDLQNPPGSLRTYSTSIRFPDRGSLTLMELNNLTYSVVAVPEPGTAVLMGLGLLGLGIRPSWQRRS